MIRVVVKKGAVLADLSLGSAAPDGIHARAAGDPTVKVADPEAIRWLDLAREEYLEVAAGSETGGE